jgi:hypothetical protein
LVCFGYQQLDGHHPNGPLSQLLAPELTFFTLQRGLHGIDFLGGGCVAAQKWLQGFSQGRAPDFDPSFHGADFRKLRVLPFGSPNCVAGTIQSGRDRRDFFREKKFSLSSRARSVYGLAAAAAH